MSKIAEMLRTGKAPGTVPTPRTIAPRPRPEPSSRMTIGVAYFQKTSKDFDLIRLSLGYARWAVMPSKVDPARPRSENAPDYFSRLSEQVSPERRAARDFGQEIAFNPFWTNTADDGTEYLNTHFTYATEFAGGSDLQLWPIPDAPAEGPHFTVDLVATPKLPPGSRAARNAGQAPTNGQATPPAEAPPATTAGEEEAIPF
jgi:hypothetical protein